MGGGGHEHRHEQGRGDVHGQAHRQDTPSQTGNWRIVDFNNLWILRQKIHELLFKVSSTKEKTAMSNCQDLRKLTHHYNVLRKLSNHYNFFSGNFITLELFCGNWHTLIFWRTKNFHMNFLQLENFRKKMEWHVHCCKGISIFMLLEAFFNRELMIENHFFFF